MLRFFAGVGSALLLIAAGFFVWKGQAQDDESVIPPAPADEPTREQRRFDRADRDNDELITLEELYHPRRRAFARLDTNGDGRLAFEEWAISTSEKFSGADSNRDRSLTRAEYATTAPRRRPSRKQNCAC